MKFTLTAVAALATGMAMQAQLTTVTGIERVALTGETYVDMPVISADGTFVVAGDLRGDGIRRIDIAKGTSRLIDAAGEPDNVAISPDGRTVAYRTVQYSPDHLRLTGLNAVNLATGAKTVVAEPSRQLNAGAAALNGAVAGVAGGKMRVAAQNGAEQPAVIASINYGHLDITDQNGESVTIDPVGPGSYLWPSISPDGTKVLFHRANDGTYVSNLDGSEPQRIGNMRAPRWMGNDRIIGMDDSDDGRQFTASNIILADLDGTTQNLTAATDEIALYPSATPDGKRVAFCTPAGDLFIINLK